MQASNNLVFAKKVLIIKLHIVDTCFWRHVWCHILFAWHCC